MAHFGNCWFLCSILSGYSEGRTIDICIKYHRYVYEISMNHRYFIKNIYGTTNLPLSHIAKSQVYQFLCTFGLSFSSSARKMAKEVSSQEENQQEYHFTLNNPTYDCIFKKVFISQSDCLKELLNAIYNVNIKDLVYIQEEHSNPDSTIGQKSVIFDVHCDRFRYTFYC